MTTNPCAPASFSRSILRLLVTCLLPSMVFCLLTFVIFSASGLAETSRTGEAATPALAAVKTMLQAGRYEEALRTVYSEVQGIAEPELAPLAEALLETAGRSGYARDIRKQLPPKPAAPPPTIRVQAGGRAWVGVSILNLRSAPSAVAPSLRRLPINLPVEVLTIKGDWARIRLKAADRIRIVFIDPFKNGRDPSLSTHSPSVPAAMEGWVMAGFLAPELLEASALRARAQTELAAGRVDEAATLFERVVALAPSDVKALRDLVGAAIDAGRFTVAAQAALALAGPGAPLAVGLEVEQVDLAYGCRGDLARAAFVTPVYAELKAGVVPKNACAVNVESQPPCGICEDEEGGVDQAEQRRAANSLAAFEARRNLLHRFYPIAPYLHAQVRNRSAQTLPASQLYVYAATNPNATDELAGYEPGYSVKLADLALPELQPFELVDLWIPVAEYSGRRYGLVAVKPANDLRKALTRLEQSATELVRGLDLAIDGMPPRRGVETSGSDCGICD